MVFRLEARQTLNTDLDNAWSFFSDPRNLPAITPPEMHFRLTNEPAAAAYPGMIITYRLSPLPAVTVSWVTEITQVAAPRYFADEQRVGPYALWHHEHHFRQAAGGVEAIDVVHWSLPLDPFSAPAAQWLVAPRLRQIFRYRAARLAERFGAQGEAACSIRAV